MSEPLPGRSTERALVPVTLAPGKEILELWMSLSASPWRSAVLVPAGRGGSTAGAAEALAEVGRRLRRLPVAAVEAAGLDYEGAARLAERLEALGATAGAQGQLVVSIPPLVTEPLGATVAQKADVVVLCIRLGQTRLAEARRTIELLGPRRPTGCLVQTSD